MDIAPTLSLAVPSMAASAPAPKIVIAGAGLHGSALAYYLTRRASLRALDLQRPKKDFKSQSGWSGWEY